MFNCLNEPQGDTLPIGQLAPRRSGARALPPSSVCGPEALPIASTTQLVALACALGADRCGGALSPQERVLCSDALSADLPASAVDDARRLIASGADPLGDLLCLLRDGRERRTVGAFYTPPSLVATMSDWLLGRDPNRVVDPGCGSGRFSAYVARTRPDLEIIAIDADPLATLLTRAALAVLNAERATVLHHDYLTAALPEIAGRTGFLGNPPYVRHHDLASQTKTWAARIAYRLNIPRSGLAGLHVLFFMATAMHMRPGDVGCFVTAAEWLDVGYGEMLRQLLTRRLSLSFLAQVAPDGDAVFDDALTTALICGFVADQQPAGLIGAQFAQSPAAVNLGSWPLMLAPSALAGASRWGPLLRGDVVTAGAGQMALASIARVHRGVATGANDYFVLTRDRAAELGLLAWCHPAITRAEEILACGGVIRDTPDRRMLLLIPPDLDRREHPQVDAYLTRGETEYRCKHRDGSPAAHTYLSAHRKPWWHLGPVKAPPIVASYMARQAPAFARNPDGLVLLNVAHGIYPHTAISQARLVDFVDQLNALRPTFRGKGRTYHSGLEKFEPREMEGLLLTLRPDNADATA